MSKRSPAPRWLSLSLMALCSPALACGPDFPLTLLDQRQQVLGELPEGSFEYEVSRLVDMSAFRFKPVEARWHAEPEGLRPADADGLDEGQQRRVLRLRELASAEDVLARGGTLPPALVHYTAGAVAWRAGDPEAARLQFEAVRALPIEQRGNHGPMAAYMLGKLYRGAASQAIYAELRAEVQAGAPDPLGLAVASFGEEARDLLEAGEYAGAVERYAQQAALGSSSGRMSLLFVARRLAPDADARAQLVATPSGRGLLLAYLFARSFELPPALPAPGEPVQAYDPWNGPYGSQDSASVLALFAELEVALAPADPARDRLAAVAYRAGRFDDAERVLAQTDSGMADWLRAKLALRRGDSEAAAAAYAQAIRSADGGEVWTARPDEVEFHSPSEAPLDMRCRLQAEAGIVALSRSDYLQAMDLFYAASARYWTDAAYLAERVLTVDELQAFVQRVAPEVQRVHNDEWVMGTRHHAAALRALLARRLLREGRGREALPYFDDETLRAQATRYVDAREAMQHGDRVARARAAFEAAELARWQGMDLLGTQLGPDHAEYGGMFSPGERWVEVQLPGSAGTEWQQLPAQPDPLALADERARVEASSPVPAHRFHYRGLAANLAEAAADQLPPRSQAYAAVMCQATRYVLNTEYARGQQLYRRYLREGPYVPWGERFGQACPAPDFDKVERELRAARIAQIQRVATWTLPPLLALGLAALWWRRRRSR
jgi:hypothetical protein